MTFGNKVRAFFGLNAELRSLNNPAIPLASPAAFATVFGGEPTASGEVVSESTALTISTVYACVRLIAESIAGIPLRVYRHTDRGREEDLSHSLSYLLQAQPNPEMSAATFFETLTTSLALNGNCYAEIERDSTGQPIAFWPLHALKTSPERTANEKLIYKTTDGMRAGKSRTIQAANILHVPLICWDGLKGLSPIQQARQELGLAIAQLKDGARVFGNGSQPGGLLIPKTPLNSEQTKQLRESFEAQSTGVNRQRLAVMPFDASYEQTALSLEDTQFIQARGYSRNAIAALFRIDSHWVGDTTRMSNANHEQSSLSLLQDTLAPYLKKLEQEFMRKLLPRTGKSLSQYEIAFDVTERLRTDMKTTLESLAVGRQWGILTANEGRKALGMNPVGSEGDVLYSPVNMIGADKFVNWTPQAHTPPPPPSEPATPKE